MTELGRRAEVSHIQPMDRFMTTLPGAQITRRRLITIGAGAVAAAALPGVGYATPEEVSAAISETFGAGAMKEGRITLKLPKLAETGNSVPISISVDSPMTDSDHVARIAVFAEQNPRPKVVELSLSPASGEAFLETNIRLAGTQTIVAVAEMSDGSLWMAREQVQVVVGACTVLPGQY